jgi:bleomycin hydrolase
MITAQQLTKFEQQFDANPANAVAMNAAVQNGIVKSAISYEAFRRERHEFSVNIKQGEITNQKASGRCWMFAALNVMRFEVMQKLNLETFEFSQSYPLFFDKLEKSNYFLENILDTLDEPTGGRLVSFLLTDPMGDGGQWDMFCGLVEKYGVVPKDAMPESVSSSATREMDYYLTLKLREFACTLRTAHEQGETLEQLRGRKEQMLAEIYQILCISLGKPPKEFCFETRDKDGNFIRDAKITPQEFFAKYVGWNLDDYVSLINAPTADKPFGKTYSVKYLGSVKEGRAVRYLNLPIEQLKAAAIAQMQDGAPVWFGCDVGKCSIRENGIMDLNVIRADQLFGVSFPMDKAQRLDYGHSLMTHAMVFLGVNLDEQGRPNRWRVENSWGKEPGKDGYYVMSDDWFTEYTYQVVVHKKYLSQEALEQLKAEPILLEPWDPMGSLAKSK